MPQGAFTVAGNPDDRRDILFRISSEGPAEVPEDQQELRDEIDATLRVLRMLFEGRDAEFYGFFNPLLRLAQGGLVGPSAQPGIAKRALAGLRQEVVAREAGRVKNRYLRELGKYSFRTAGVALVVGFILLGVPHITSIPDSQPVLDLTTMAAFSFLIGGCCLGVWLSFAARKTELTFDDLHIPERDRLDPLMRIAFVGLLTVVLSLLFATGILEVALGPVSTHDVFKQPVIAFLVGALCGVSELVLPKTVTSQASRLFSD